MAQTPLLHKVVWLSEVAHVGANRFQQSPRRVLAHFGARDTVGEPRARGRLVGLVGDGGEIRARVLVVFDALTRRHDTQTFFRAKAQALARAIADVEMQSQRLTSMLGALLALEANMNAPIQTLETGVAALADGESHDAELQRLRRAVTRLREFSNSMPDISIPTDVPNARAQS